jgi:hypothetical protein
MIGLSAMDQLTGGRLGQHDVPCPLCGPLRSTVHKQRKRVLRIWRLEPGFGTFHCTRCGEGGYARDRNGPPPDSAKVARARHAAAEHARVITTQRLGVARWLWRRRRPITGSIAETYLRSARGYGGVMPATLGFLPAWRDHPPALIGAFGLATEPEPGALAIADDAVLGVHLVKLRSDGSDRLRDRDFADGESAKVTVGQNFVAPIVLATPNDLLGLAVVEGIEDGLSVHQTTGLGAWAAGCASRMPALAAMLPANIDSVSVIADDDRDGRRYAADLAAGARARGIEARAIIAGATLGDAA